MIHRVLGKFNQISGRIHGFYRRTFSKRILLYTDSRGTNIPDNTDYKHYGTRLSNLFYVDAYYCPEKWTTVLDFLQMMKSIPHGYYHAIILHAGAVDAAPRHQKVLLETIYPDKKGIFDEIFGENKIKAYLHSDLGCDYEGDKTINMYSPEMARRQLLPLVKQIPHVIWISSNRIVPNWRGNYWKDRPDNIGLIEEYSNLFAAELESVVNLMSWSLEEVKLCTFDNIHPNQMGSDRIFEMILLHLKNFGF